MRGQATIWNFIYKVLKSRRHSPSDAGHKRRPLALGTRRATVTTIAYSRKSQIEYVWACATPLALNSVPSGVARVLRNTILKTQCVARHLHFTSIGVSSFSNLIVAAVLLLASAAVADEAAQIPGDTTTEGLIFFETQVRPLLAKRCYECHSSETGAQNGALVMETAEGIAVGGSRGSMFANQSPEDGLLYQTLDYSNPDLQMPPDGKLQEAELEILKRWIRNGAVLPEYKSTPRTKASQIDWDAGRKFWSFQPLTRIGFRLH